MDEIAICGCVLENVNMYVDSIQCDLTIYCRLKTKKCSTYQMILMLWRKQSYGKKIRNAGNKNKNFARVIEMSSLGNRSEIYRMLTVVQLISLLSL